MNKYRLTCLAVLLSLTSAHAGVVGIDFSTDSTDGPGPDMLPGVIGKTTTNVIWNTVGSANLKTGLTDENGLATGASFQFGTNSAVIFASKSNDTSADTGFFRTYSHLASGGNTNAFTNSFTIAGLETATADLVCYATWGWIIAGSEFRVSGDDGTTWTDWTLCDGDPNKGEAAFSEGHSYISFTNVAVSGGTILGEWATTMNGGSLAHRGPFNAIQIDATYADALAPAFSSDVFGMSPATGGEAYEDDLSDALVSQGSQYVFSNLTTNTWLTIAADGTLGGTPTPADEGENTFSVMVSDDLGNSDTATMSIYVSVIHNRYIDNFDGDGIGINTAKGGGLEQISASASYPLTVTDDGTTSTNLAFTQGPNGNLGAARSGVATLQKFSVVNGFDLEVVYTIVTVNEPAVLSDSAGFGLVDTNTTTAFEGLFVLDNKSTANSLGISLTERGLQGVTQTDWDGTATPGTTVSLNNDQLSAPGTNLVANLTVEADGSFSYSLDGGATWSVGITTFDLTKEYHFAAWCQRHSTGFELVSVSFVPKGTVNSVGDISIEMISSTEAGFSWYGETGGNYALQVRDNLVIGGEAAWQTVTTVPGYDTEISVTDDVDQSEAFYRVKLVDPVE